jgi:hypothetical protein
MSVRYEGAGARDVSVFIATAGEEVGDDVVPEGQIALCLSYDEVFYIVGTKAQVSSLLNRALHRVEERG